MGEIGGGLGTAERERHNVHQARGLSPSSCVAPASMRLWA